MRTFALMTGAVVVALLTGLATAQTPGPATIVVEDAWARNAQRPTGAPHGGPGAGAIFLILRNTGPVNDALVGVTSEVAETVGVHETVQEGDASRMQPLTRLEIPAGGTIILQPGGLHIMLLRLRQPLLSGNLVPITLTFERSTPVTLQVPVRQ